MKRKGQKSLEMIIGLVILLVVAGVVISTFLNQFQNNPGSQYQETLKKEEIKRECQSLCSQYKDATGINAKTAAIEYCTKVFQFDASGDGTVTQVAGRLYNSYCENGVHCFNVQRCQIGYETLNAQKCKEIMCNYYKSVANAQNPGERVKSWYKPNAEGDRTIGTCGLQNLKNSVGGQMTTWFSQNFQGQNICQTNTDTGTSTSTDITAQEWCSQNVNADAAVDGCRKSGKKLQYGGEDYLASNNPQIGQACGPGEAFYCTK